MDLERRLLLFLIKWLRWSEPKSCNVLCPPLCLQPFRASARRQEILWLNGIEIWSRAKIEPLCAYGWHPWMRRGSWTKFKILKKKCLWNQILAYWGLYSVFVGFTAIWIWERELWINSLSWILHMQDSMFLSNIYDAELRWRDTERVSKLMVERKVFSGKSRALAPRILLK